MIVFVSRVLVIVGFARRIVCCCVGVWLLWSWYLRRQPAVHLSSTRSRLLLLLRTAHTCRKPSFTACEMIMNLLCLLSTLICVIMC